MDVRRVADAGELADAAADEILERARAAVAERGRFHLALAGGSTPRRTYEVLRRRGSEIDASRWHAWFGDERCVPPADASSNYRMAQEAWLGSVFPDERVHRIRGEAADLPGEARRYEAELRSGLGSPPRLDLVLLGLGPDGHVASLFPGTPALEESRALVTVGRAPRPPLERLTLTLVALNLARCVLFLAAGAEKAQAVARALEPPGESPLPVHRVRPSSGTVVWIVDRAASAEARG